MKAPFSNPFRPGAGQSPPFLAGRVDELRQFEELLGQEPVSQNLILTGLRGVGKSVLLEALKPIAQKSGWFWAGTDLSESASVSEQTLAIRVMTDLSTVSSSFAIYEDEKMAIGFSVRVEKEKINLTYENLAKIYDKTPGLETDKLKAVLELAWKAMEGKVKGVVLAYDEAQNLKDQATDKQYPLSVLLEVIQYLQRREIPYLLVFTGLPTLFPNLIATRTYAERMFHVVTLGKLSDQESRDAIQKPIADSKCPVTFAPHAIDQIVKFSGGYPYFIQFFGKETFDSYINQQIAGLTHPAIYLQDIVRKLDNDFYSGRWNKVTDRQRDLLKVIAKLPNANDEFSIQEIIEGDKSFNSSHVNQMLTKLITDGLIYKNRHGIYSFAVPLMADYINRQIK